MKLWLHTYISSMNLSNQQDIYYFFIDLNVSMKVSDLIEQEKKKAFSDRYTKLKRKNKATL